MQLSPRARRLLLLAATLGSGIALLDTTVVTVALPTIQRDLGGGLAAQQWVSNAYLLTLGSLILVGGSLGDLFGPRRVFAAGIAAFASTSLLCALAPSVELLVAGRALQGVAGALMVPGALAVIVSSFPASDRGGAIGTWTAGGAVATVIGPLAGGELLAVASWRWIFLFSLPFAALCLALLARADAEGSGVAAVGTDPPQPGRARRTRTLPIRHHVDALGGLLCALGLGGVVFALIEQPRLGFASPGVWGPLLAGGAGLGAFLVHESRAPAPMLTLELFARRNFAAGNVETVLVYGGLSTMLFFLGLFLQQVAGYSPLQAGLSTLPTTVVMFSLSRRTGALAARLGPRRFMTGGPLLLCAGLLLMQRVGDRPDYLSDLLPAIVVFALGLVCTVAPLTAAVLAGVEEDRAGIASGINNALARLAGLLATAAVGAVVAGHFTALVRERLPAHALSPPARRVVDDAVRLPLGQPDTRGLARGEADAVSSATRRASVSAFHLGLGVAAALAALGALVAALGIRDPARPPPARQPGF